MGHNTELELVVIPADPRRPNRINIIARRKGGMMIAFAGWQSVIKSCNDLHFTEHTKPFSLSVRAAEKLGSR